MEHNQNRKVVDGVELERGLRMRHAKYGEIEVDYSVDRGWHYLRLGYAGFSNDFENVTKLGAQERKVGQFSDGQPVIFNSTDAAGIRNASATVVRRLGPEEVDEHDVGPMYLIRLAEGSDHHAFADELQANDRDLDSHELSPGWSQANDDAAAREGWGIFDANGSENGRWQLQRIDDVEAFEDAAGFKPVQLSRDDDAFMIVANGSGQHHVDAREFLKAHNPQEYEAVMGFKGQNLGPERQAGKPSVPNLNGKLDAIISELDGLFQMGDGSHIERAYGLAVAARAEAAELKATQDKFGPFKLTNDGKNPLGLVAECCYTGDPGIYDEARISVLSPSGECVGDALVGLDQHGELRVLVTAGADGDGDHPIAIFPMRVVGRAVEIDDSCQKSNTSDFSPPM